MPAMCSPRKTVWSSLARTSTTRCGKTGAFFSPPLSLAHVLFQACLGKSVVFQTKTHTNTAVSAATLLHRSIRFRRRDRSRCRQRAAVDSIRAGAKGNLLPRSAWLRHRLPPPLKRTQRASLRPKTVRAQPVQLPSAGWIIHCPLLLIAPAAFLPNQLPDGSSARSTRPTAPTAAR